MLNRFKAKFLTLLLCISGPTFAPATPSDPSEVNPLEVGNRLPEVDLTDTAGQQRSLSQITAGGKNILIFYRGSWCPYCTRHLAAIGQHEQALLDRGYRIIAISPDQAETAQEYAAESEFNYSIYSDPELSAIKAFGLAFKWQNPKTGHTQIRPVPAIFITDTEGRITFRHFDANYKERLSPEALFEALE
ncbi:peroxiredoxin-like family protein [Coraliomargarita algicola]|uniref:Peroxiredoxin-like family protein n=1 Tax=Coraliomargarita algicola TaxID=3092156 RepID=A0ABZ0RSE5_9BACT|nr:peroxiredoxin-like family protein [Coraliomargarita sp. J2-16]WPJ97822.1 peroxiredoxin-like family protein [Coraliomargarita sp. J2-16]